MRVGRNDHCRCGSGKKYKKCCLSEAALAGAMSEPAGARAEGPSRLPAGPDLRPVIDAVAEYARRSEFDGALRTAVSLFDDGRLAARTARESSTLTSGDDWGMKLTWWCLFDFPLSTQGKTVAQLFLENEGHRLDARQRNHLRRLVRTGLRPYEVCEVLLDRGLRLRDLWTEEALPALNGRTPRQAARLKSLRPKLIGLLKDMENHEARASRPDNPAFDFGLVWQELGLERPT